MAAQLPRPGVEVLQVFSTTSPTVVTPTLVPVIVGVCRQIVDVVIPNAAGANELNPASLIDLPGFFIAADATGDPIAYTGLDGLDLDLSIDNGPDISITFAGDSLSPVAVVAQIAAAFEAQGVTAASVEVTPDGLSFRVFTIGTGEFESIQVLTTSAPQVLAQFGVTAGYVYTGTSFYSQSKLVIPLLSFPDPRSNLAELAIEPASVEVFLDQGSGVSGLRRLSETSAFLRHGGGGTVASIAGTASFSGASYPLGSNVLNVTIDEGSPVVVTLTGAAGVTEVLERINLALGGQYATDVTNNLVITSKTDGPNSGVLLSGTACATFGLSTAQVNGLSGVVVADSGNGTSVSPLLDFVGMNWSATETVASCTGVVDLTTLTYPSSLTGKTLELAVSGNDPQTITFTTAITSLADLLAAINAYWPDIAATDPSNFLVLTTSEKGEQATIDVLGGTALGTLGLAPNFVGNVDLTTITPDLTTLNGLNVKFNLGGTAVQYTFSGLTNISVPSAVAAQLNAFSAFNTLAVASISSNKLAIRLLTGGAVGGVPVTAGAVPASSAEASYWLGFDPTKSFAFTHFLGGGFPPMAGDTLYVDGTLIGTIVQVAPGAITSRLKVNKQLTITAAFGSFWYIVANNLVVDAAHRPNPELIVDGTGVPTLSAGLLRDTNGNLLLAGAFAPVYLQYSAIREDVTAMSKTPSLLSFTSTAQLDSILDPVTVQNPLALGVYFALLNGPGIAVSALGVDAVSGDEPFGTVEAWTRAATVLEQYEVYAIAPLTHDPTVGQIFSTHVTAMSEPAAKGERICLYNFSQPTKRLDALVASGVQGNSIGSSGLVFDTGIVNLPSLVLAQGVNPVGSIPTSAGLFLDINDGKHYSVISLNGGVVTIRTTFLAGENDDGYYATTAFNTPPNPAVLIDETFALRVRGAALLLPDGTPDKDSIALTMQQQAQAILNRRFWSIVPDTCAATIGGVEQIIDGFYLCAGITGMIGQQPPQQSFTNFPMTGYTRVIGSNNYFTETQLNVIAFGGNYIVVQDVQSGPLTSRMALTTDMTSIETRTDSITKIVDFTAKFMRSMLRTYIGRFNITQGFLDSLGHVTQGGLTYLSEIGVLIGAHMNNIVQDETTPDTVMIDVTLDPPYPCNYIRLTLVI